MFVGLVHALALLLAVAAVAKVWEPTAVSEALRRAMLPSSVTTVRVLAGSEATVAGAVLLVGGVVPSVALGLLHLGFAAFIVRLRRAAGATAGCGCFGNTESPAHQLHVVVNVVAGGLVVVSLAGSLPSLPSVLGDSGGLAVPYAMAVVLGAWATGLCLTSLPALLAAQRQVTA